MKSYFMLSVEDEELRLDSRKSEILRETNPQNRTYIIGVKLRDFFFKEFQSKRYAFSADVAICLSSKFPFFEFHRKVLMMVCSKVTPNLG